MSLEPLQFQKDATIGVKNTLITLQQIKDIVYRMTKVSVSIKKYQPPKLVMYVDSSSAASELQLQSDILIQKLSDYSITQIQVITR